MALEKRSGVRPRTSDEGPHRQLDQQAPPELWGRLVFEATRLPHVVEGRSQVSPVSSRALLFDDLTEVKDGSTSLAAGPPLEPAHLHGVTDTSIHLCLPAERAKEVCELGWGEPHGYADHDTEIMVYGPRDAGELEVVLALIAESLVFARSASTNTWGHA
ncbi:luciferase domain-containing protein [Flindersiella endophytica]